MVENKQTAVKKNKPKDSSSDESFFTPKMMEAGEIQTLISWEAPSRPFRRKNKSYYFTSAMIVVLLVLILLLMSEFLLIAVLFALLFVVYVLAFVPPQDIPYRISTQGITIGENFYLWHYMDAFWFKEKEGHRLLIIQTRLVFPSQLMLVLPSSDEEKIKKTVARFLPYVEVPYKSMMEKWSEGLQKNFPLESIKK